tara:strand:+ start:24477 stop:24683 length:207 start_codon:yes stop_codon:yes gene_type:complete
MIELIGHEGYFLDIQSFRIFSSHSKGYIKPKYDGRKKVFTLYKNGVPFNVSLFDLLKTNLKNISKKLS